MDGGSIKAALRDKLCPRQNLFSFFELMRRNLKALGHSGRLMFSNADRSSVPCPCPHGFVQENLPYVCLLHFSTFTWLMKETE